MTIAGLIGLGIALGLISAAILPAYWSALGCFLWPAVAAAAALVYVSGLPHPHSTAALAIPFAAIWVCCGSLPGALIGNRLARRRHRRAGE